MIKKVIFKHKWTNLTKCGGKWNKKHIKIGIRLIKIVKLTVTTEMKYFVYQIVKDT